MVNLSLVFKWLLNRVYTVDFFNIFLFRHGMHLDIASRFASFSFSIFYIFKNIILMYYLNSDIFFCSFFW